MIIDQSSGADGIITRSNVQSYQEIFNSPVAMAGGCSVSEYFYRTLAWSFGVFDTSNLRLTKGPSEAVDMFAKDQSVKTVVTYAPFTFDALAVPNSKEFLNTANWAGILDVAVIKDDSKTSDAVQRFLAAWFDFLKLEHENFDQAWQFLDQWHKGQRETTLITAYDHDILKDELTNAVAQGTPLQSRRNNA
jgi:ABC-type nitrate/sulfonate/bicarbonate transport system substrate-binding protein